MQFLLEESDNPNSLVVSSLLSGGSYLNLYHLLELDTEAALDVLRCAFVADANIKSDFTEHDSSDPNLEATLENDLIADSDDLLVQNTINALVNVLDKDKSKTDGHASNSGHREEVWPSNNDIGHLFEFIAYYVSCGRANVSKRVLCRILEYLTSEKSVSQNTSNHGNEISKREKQVLALLEVVSEIDWNASYVLHLCENACFYKVYILLLLHLRT